MEYSSYLAGIEYMYAIICEDIVNYIEGLTLHCEQSHYAKHADLDWEHGAELIEVACSLGKDTESIKKYFEMAQNDFLHMYGNLFMPTLGEMKLFSNEKISFYYSRENSEIEKKALRDVNSRTPSVLLICSGGEHLFEMMASDKSVIFDMIDINQEQINLTKKKLSVIMNDNNDNNNCLNEQNVGKFEKMFQLLRSFFTEDEKSLLIKSDFKTQKKLEFIVNILFSNNYLNTVFGEEATKYTIESFAEHFNNVFSTKICDMESNIMNIFFGNSVRDFEKIKNEIHSHHVINWILSHPKNLKTEKKYDIIDISNIGDWMCRKEFNDVIDNVKTMMNPQAKIIARKLLGDYSLEETLSAYGFKCNQVIDETNFYTEVIIAQ